MASPKGKQEPRRQISAAESPALGKCRLGAMVFYRFLLNLYSMPTEMAKLTSYWEYAGVKGVV